MTLFVYNDKDDPRYDARRLFAHTRVYAYAFLLISNKAAPMTAQRSRATLSAISAASCGSREQRSKEAHRRLLAMSLRSYDVRLFGNS